MHVVQTSAKVGDKATILQLQHFQEACQVVKHVPDLKSSDKDDSCGFLIGILTSAVSICYFFMLILLKFERSLLSSLWFLQ